MEHFWQLDFLEYSRQEQTIFSVTFVLNVCTFIILGLESSEEGVIGYYDESKSGSYLVPLILLLLMNVLSNFGTSSIF